MFYTLSPFAVSEFFKHFQKQMKINFCGNQPVDCNLQVSTLGLDSQKPTREENENNYNTIFSA